jgi:hypothetical protein
MKRFRTEVEATTSFDWTKFPVKDKVFVYSLKLEGCSSRLRPLNLTEIRNLLHGTALTEVGKNEFSGTINIEGLYGERSLKIIKKQVGITLRVNDATKQILIVVSKAPN